ncbi:MAG TPA: hypothetical protein VGE51_08735 [Fontimonas sp.]
MNLRALAFVVAALLPSGVNAANYATCILDEVPKTRTDAAAISVSRACNNLYPGGMAAVQPGSGLGGLFAYDSGAECVKKKTKGLRSESATTMVRFACNRLYNENAAGAVRR